MSNLKAKIPVKRIRFFNVAEVPVISADGTEESMKFPEVNNKILVPVSKARDLGLSVSTIRRWLRKGVLTAYNANGTRKYGTGSTRVYFDLRQWHNVKYDDV